MLKSRRSLITGILSGLEVDAAQFVWGSKPFASDQVESAFALLSRQIGGVILFRRIPKKVSADRSVHEYEQAGVQPSKFVFGCPLLWTCVGEVPDGDHGLFRPGNPVPGAFAHYSNISASMLISGFTRYWDPSDVQNRRANDHRLRKRRDGR